MSTYEVVLELPTGGYVMELPTGAGVTHRRLSSLSSLPAPGILEMLTGENARADSCSEVIIKWFVP